MNNTFILHSLCFSYNIRKHSLAQLTASIYVFTVKGIWTLFHGNSRFTRITFPCTHKNTKLKLILINMLQDFPCGG